MQSVFVIITKLIASKNYFCKEVFCNNFVRDGTVLVFFRLRCLQLLAPDPGNEDSTPRTEHSYAANTAGRL